MEYEYKYCNTAKAIMVYTYRYQYSLHAQSSCRTLPQVPPKAKTVNRFGVDMDARVALSSVKMGRQQ